MSLPSLTWLKGRYMMIRKWLSFGLILMLSVCWFIPQAAMADSVTVYSLSSSTSATIVDDEITVIVKGDNLTDVYGYEVNLDFDSSKLEFKRATSAIKGFAISPRVQGNHVQFANTKTGQVPGDNGSVTLCSMTFKAISQGTAFISLGKVILGTSNQTYSEQSSDVSISIEVSAKTVDTGGNNNSNNNTNNNPSAVDVKDGVVRVNLNSEQMKADIPLEQIAGNSLVVQADEVSIAFDKLNINALTALTSNIEGASFHVQIVPQQSSSVSTTGQNNLAQLKAAGMIYDIVIKLKEADGNEIDIRDVMEGTHISLLVKSTDVDKELLGVYFLNEMTKQWEYVRSTVDYNTNAVSANISHLGKFAVFEYNKTFTDIPADNWAYRTLQVLSAKHIVSGVTANMFNPKGKTTRAEFTALLNRALDLKPSSQTPSFTDVGSDDWYAKDVAEAYASGLIQGISDKEFAPNEEITREQMAVLLVRAYEYKHGHIINSSNELQAFKDGTNVSDWAKDEVNKAIAAGMMHGKGDAVFDPSAEALRAETAQAILNLIQNK